MNNVNSATPRNYRLIKIIDGISIVAIFMDGRSGSSGICCSQTRSATVEMGEEGLRAAQQWRQKEV